MEEEMIFEDEKVSRLYRKVTTTAKCKHNASARMKTHHLLSQWTLALISTVLIVTPLVETIRELNAVNTYQEYLTAIQVGFAILVLVASLLVGTLSFPLRVDRFHNCGVELDKLSYRILNNDNPQEYYDLYCRYMVVLEKYENHKSIDHIQKKNH